MKKYIAILITLLVALFLGLTSYDIKTQLQSKQEDLVENAIKRGVVQCYAIEGRYPPSVDYLEEHYGLRMDNSKYIVHYDILASNIYPDITVIERKWRGDNE